MIWLVATPPAVAGGSGEWTGQQIATLIAAILAALAAIVGAIITNVNQSRTAEQTRQLVMRDQWWGRFRWAVEAAVSDDARMSELGLSVLLALIGVLWATAEDNEMALAVADLIAPEPATEGSAE